MKRNDVLEIANRLKREGRAISPVSVCLEAYGQSLSEISVTLQKWREEGAAPVDLTLATLPAPEDFGDVIRDAIQHCWMMAQKSVRGQVEEEIRALKERAEQAERETGMLYVDLTRTLNELDTCKHKLSQLQHPAVEASRMITGVEADTTRAIVDGRVATAIEAPATRQSDQSALDEQSPSVGEQAYNAQIDRDAIGMNAVSDLPFLARPFDEAETVLPDVALEQAAKAPVSEAESFDRLAEQLALAEERASAYEVRVQELEGQLANATQQTKPRATDPMTAQEAGQRITEMETVFTRQQQALQTKLDETILQCTQWKQRAEQLRTGFAPLQEHAAWVNAQSIGRNALCNRLLVELARTSPGNPLLRKEVQQQIVDQAAQRAVSR